ncbi:UNVERIFIED_CONTAM: hypothetical protein GTU68_048675 [Idotea baltica]
MLLFL